MGARCRPASTDRPIAPPLNGRYGCTNRRKGTGAGPREERDDEHDDSTRDDRHPPGARPQASVDALHAAGGVSRQRDPDLHPGIGKSSLRRAGPVLPRRPGEPVRRAGRARPGRPRRRGAQPGGGARLLPDLVGGPPRRHRIGDASRRARTRRSQPGVLHHRGLRSRRVGVEARPCLLQGHRAARAHKGDRPRSRLSRHDSGCARHHRASRPAPTVRAGHAGRRARRQHEPVPLPLRGRGHSRRRPLRDRLRGRHRERHCRRGARDRGRGLPGAHAEHGRLLRPSSGLLRPGSAPNATGSSPTCSRSPKA